VHLGVLSHEPRSQHIVHAAHDEGAEQGECRASPDLSGGHEDDRRRYPHERAADARDNRQDGHHRSPEDRPVNTYGPERQPAKKALSHADQNRALERRAGDGHKLPHHALLVGFCEWQVPEHASEQARTAGQEEKHRVEQDKELKDESAVARVVADRAAKRKALVLPTSSPAFVRICAR
jgi:hypothetical protein